MRSILGGVNYHGKFLPNFSRRLRPFNAQLKQGATFYFTPVMEATIRAILHELTEPSIVVYPNWDAIAVNSDPFPPASTATLATTPSERLSSTNNLTASSDQSSTSAAPTSTPNVHEHPSTSRPAPLSGRSSDYAGICGPPASRYIRTIRHSRISSRLARVPFGLYLHAGVPQRYGKRQRQLPFTPTPTSHRRRPHRAQSPHWPRHCWYLPHPPL